MKIGIVGAGLVGSTAAFALVMQGVGRHIVLVDASAKRAVAEAEDILHAVPFAHALQVGAGSYADLAGSKVVIIAAGVGQRPGESRMASLGRNVEVFRQIVPQVLAQAPQAVLVVATNPVDVMTHVAARFAAEYGVPASRVIGSGTTLDSARFRTLLGRHLGVDAHHVHGYVIGEHGDSEVLVWSRVAIGGMSLQEFCERQEIPLDEEKRRQMDEDVRRAAYRIIDGKGATYYGIGSALARIVKVILGDRRAVMSVCTPKDEVAGVRDVTLSLPHLLGGEGIISTLPLTLTVDEEEALGHSARTVRAAIEGLADKI